MVPNQSVFNIDIMKINLPARDSYIFNLFRTMFVNNFLELDFVGSGRILMPTD